MILIQEISDTTTVAEAAQRISESAQQVQVGQVMDFLFWL